jgi:hypothetical protein
MGPLIFRFRAFGGCVKDRFEAGARALFRDDSRLVAVDARAPGMHLGGVNKPKKAKHSKAPATPGTVMAAKIRARANKLTDSEREALMGDAMRIIYGSEGNAVRAHRR